MRLETTIENTRQKADVSVVKKDSDTENPLDGGKYTLYAGNDIKNYAGQVIVTKGTALETVTTGEDGKAKGIAFVKSRRAELNVVQMVESMRDQAISNGVIINDAYCDRSMTRDYDREALNAFFATLKEEDFEVVVVRSLNEITDDIYDLEEFVKTITDMGIWLYSLEVGPVPITVSHAEDFGC